MPGKPQITAKIGGDAEGLQKSLGGLRKSFAGFAKDVGAKLKAAAVAGMAGAAAGMAATLKSGFDQKVMLEQSETLMKSLMGGAENARKAMQMLGEEAAENPMFSKKIMVEAGAALANYAGQNSERLRGLVETAQKLSVLNPEQGIAGAAYALKEALGGDYVSLAERFNISKSTIRDLKEAGLEGKTLIDTILQQQGITQQTLIDQGNTMGGQIQKLKSQWQAMSLQVVEGMWPKLQEVAQKFMAWFEANKGQIIELLSTAATVMGQLIMGAFDFGIAVKNGIEQAAAFLGGWWAEFSQNFSLEAVMRWIGLVRGAIIDAAQGLVLKIVSMVLGKMQELSPRLFDWFGGDTILEKVNAAAASNFSQAGSAVGQVAREGGINAGMDQLVQQEMLQRQRAAEIAAKAQANNPAQQPTVRMRIDMAGYNGVPKMMGAT